MTFFVDFHICCIENDQKKSHSTIIIAIRSILVSLDSVWRSVGTWRDNIRCLALPIQSSLVLHTSGENLETKNDDISGSRGFYDAFEDVLRPQQHSRKGCECMIWEGVLFLMETLDLFVWQRIHSPYKFLGVKKSMWNPDLYASW